MQQRLRGDAAAERTDAARIRIGIDERDLHADVGRMKRGDVPTGSGAYHC
jgi:hypothetical protein